MQRIGLYKPQLLTTLKSNVSVVTTIKASAIAIAVIAIYYQDLNIVFNDALRNEATSLETKGRRPVSHSMSDAKMSQKGSMVRAQMRLS